MKLARRLLSSEPLAPYYDYEDFPGPDVQTDDEFLVAATQRAHDHLPPRLHLPHGPGDRSDWRWWTIELRVHGLRGSARHRRLDHAAHDLGQPQCLDLDDRRQGIRSGARTRRTGSRHRLSPNVNRRRMDERRLNRLARR